VAIELDSKEAIKRCRLSAMGKHHTATFKAHLVRELLRDDKTISQIAAEHGVHPNQLGTWKASALQGLPRLYDRADGVATLKATHDQPTSASPNQVGGIDITSSACREAGRSSARSTARVWTSFAA